MNTVPIRCYDSGKVSSWEPARRCGSPVEISAEGRSTDRAGRRDQPLVRNEVTQNSLDIRVSGLFAPQAVRGYENWSNAYNESRYYNLDLRTGKEVTLKDLLGDDYEELANLSIQQQIAEREQAGESFFAEDAGGFKGISENTKFYIGANHNPVIVFDKYEIANGAAGEIEFEIGG